MHQGGGGVLDLHHHALEGLNHGGDIKQVKNDGLVLAEHVATRDREDERVGNLASSASNEHSNRFSLEGRVSYRIIDGDRA